MPWNGNTTNEDGLLVRFGTERSAVSTAGGKTSENQHRTLTYQIADATALLTSDTAAAGDEDAVIPAGSIITRATLYVTTAFASGGAPTLDIGLKQADGTEITADGIDADIALEATNALGDTIICNGAYIVDSDLTGLRLTTDAYVKFQRVTATYTAGAATLVVEYMELE